MRKFPSDYHALAKNRQFKWLGPEVHYIKDKTMWECEKGHQWEAPFARIYRGHGCPTCAVEKMAEQRRLKPVDYHALAAQRDYIWLGPKVLNARTKTGWKCQYGHQWKTSYGNIQQGRGCPTCAIEKQAAKRRLKAIDYHTMAQKRGFQWLGPEVPNNRTKTRWKCERNHQWNTSYDHIQAGSNCPYCTGKASKIKRDYIILAQNRNFYWRGGKLPKDTMTKTLWECNKEHKWKARYNDILQGTGCPVCAKVARKAERDYVALGKEHGFAWRGKKLPPNTHTKTFWECKKHGKWETSFNKIRQGRGCPQCADMINGCHVSQIQRQLCELLDGQLNYPCGSYRIDVALPNKKIAVEYDSWYWHGDRLEEDEQRDADLLSAGWRILHVKSGNQLPTKKQIDNALSILCEDKETTEIILNDWGRGTTFTNDN